MNHPPSPDDSGTSDALVSCIIIFLNGAPFLDEAIESVLGQSYGHWELWLVDDGSTDGSSETARRFAAKYPNIYYLEHEGHSNQGMSASRNLGIRHARGTYVAFLDADDLWLPTKLAEQVTILEAHPAVAMVYGRTLIWYSWQGEKQPHADRFYALGVTPNQVIEPPRLFPLLMANRVQTPTTCNFMVRRTLFATVGAFEDAFRGMYEDQVFFVKTHLAVPIYVADRVWAKYRQHPASSSSVFAKQQEYFAARLRFLQWVESYLQTAQPQDAHVWAALRREMWRCRHPRLVRWMEGLQRQWGGWMRTFREGAP
jgi:glycosyltransferase involved in cell wall biosynthesis